MVYIKLQTNKSHVCRIITASNYENNYLQPLPSFEKSESCSVVSDSLWPHGLYSPWNSPDQNTGVGSHSLLQSIFPNAGIEPRSPALQADSLPTEPPGGRPRILEWVAYPFFSGSSQSRNRTSVSCIAGGFFTYWAIREVHSFENEFLKTDMFLYFILSILQVKVGFTFIIDP